MPSSSGPSSPAASPASPSTRTPIARIVAASTGPDGGAGSIRSPGSPEMEMPPWSSSPCWNGSESWPTAPIQPGARVVRRSPGTMFDAALMSPHDREAGPDRNLAMELVRVTEAAALAASRWMGRGQERGRRRRRRRHAHRARHACRWTASSSSARARRTRRRCSTTASASATAPRPPTDIAVDPIDGTTLTALGRGNAIAVIAVSERGTMFDPGPCVYMEKIAVGPDGVGVIDITRPADREPRGAWPRPRAEPSATSPP